MMMRLKFAIRNILRHRGLTFVSLLTIAGAVVCLVLFVGFSDYILANMQRIMIDNQYGHIQIGKKAYWAHAPGSRKVQLVSDAKQLVDRIAAEPDVETASGRLSFFGLISSGDITISAKGLGFDPKAEPQFGKNLAMAEGEPLNENSKLDVVLGIGLQQKINVQLGGTLTVLSYTLDGVVNAVDLNIKGIFNSGNTEVDDNLFMVPLSTAQMLLDTDQVEVIAVRIRKTEKTAEMNSRLQAVSSQVNEVYETKTWFELSAFYRQVESFFQTQNRVIQIILLSLVFLGIMNTIGVSVYDRTGEIGTVRALGESHSSIIFQFALEGLALGLLGGLIGVVLGYVVVATVTGIGFTMELPGTSHKIPIVIHNVLSAYIEAVIIVMVTAVMATLIPSIRAAKMPIVEALRKNI